MAYIYCTATDIDWLKLDFIGVNEKNQWKVIKWCSLVETEEGQPWDGWLQGPAFHEGEQILQRFQDMFEFLDCSNQCAI